MRRWAVAVLVAAALQVAPAGAHDTDPFRIPRLDAVEPAPPDRVVLQVHTLIAPQFVADNPTRTVLAVLDEAGREFLRISAAGVYGDTGADAWWESNTPASTDAPDGPAEWRLLSRGTSWGWFDHRLHARGAAGWRVPFRYGDRPLTARGSIEQIPEGYVDVRLTGAPAGVEADVLPAALHPGLFVRTVGEASVLVVYGVEGEPFLRLGPRGGEVNRVSPTHAEDLRLRGHEVSGVVDASRAPAWELEDGIRALSWVDPRLALGPGRPDRTSARSWTIPVELDGMRGAITGSTTWRPGRPPPLPDTSGPRPEPGRWAVAALLVLLLGSAAGWATLRRSGQVKRNRASNVVRSTDPFE